MSERSREWSSDRTKREAEIEPIPAVVNPRRRARCEKSLLAFLTTYFPHSTGLKPFSEDHKRVIARIERFIRNGGRGVNCVYRSFAKTTISENATIWATLTGLRKFALIVGVNLPASTNNIDSIKAELAENDLLAEDFPEVCYPIRKLEGKPQRAMHQTCHSELTHIVFKADTIVLPTIPGSLASGAVIIAKPFKKARGLKYKRRDGTQIRPDLVIADDIEDDETSATPGQVNKNLNVLKKGILQSAGRRSNMACVINGTLIGRGSMLDKLLHDSAWEGEAVPLVKRWPDAHETFWLKDYADTRRAWDRTKAEDRARACAAATSLYRKRRKEADKGAEVSWIHAHKPDELSAIQSAYNILIDDGEAVLASEYQQDPIDESARGPLHITTEALSAKLTGLDRAVVPKACQHIAAYVDVHSRLLYYCVSAWSQSFGGGPVEYGTYPRQPTAYFAMDSCQLPMADVHRGMGEDAWILASLQTIVGELLAREYRREDGAALRIGRLLIDAKWGEKTELVKQFCRRHPQGGSIVLPAMGLGLGPSRKSFGEYRPEPGSQTGLNWRLVTQAKGDRVVIIDTNWWKTFAAGRLLMPVGTPGGWELWGRQPGVHALFFDHCQAEAARTLIDKASGRERTVWELKPGSPDNHWWDCLTGSGVAGAMLGAMPDGIEAHVRHRRPASERPSAAELAGKR